MQPSRHFTQHHDLDPPRIDRKNFRVAWRVATRFDQLFLDGCIDEQEWLIAASWGRAWEVALAMRAKSILEPAQGNNQNPGDWVTVRRLDALAVLRMAREALGEQTELLKACVVDDLSWPALGRALHVSNHTARAWTIKAIKMLTSASKSD